MSKDGNKQLQKYARIAGYLCSMALFGILCLVAIGADHRTRRVQEYAFGCDPFGYLQMAQSVRLASVTHQWPDFRVESEHTRLLIDMAKSRGLPVSAWGELVAPHCHHYLPRSDVIGVQYPPGTGLMMALFPVDRALHGLDRLVISISLLVGLITMLIAAKRQAWLSAGLVLLALSLGLEMLARISDASYSINAVFAPLSLCALCLVAAFVIRINHRRTLLLAASFVFLAGVFFGFATLVRLQITFLLFGVLTLLAPAKLRLWYRSAWLPFLFGILIGGVLPTAVHQSRLAGAWYLPTYGIGNTDPPLLSAIRPNLHFYFGAGKASQFLWGLLMVLIGFVAVAFRSRNALTEAPTERIFPLSWRRVSLSALVMWLAPTIYFLTHEVTGHHYPIPTIFATSLLLALGAVALENSGTGVSPVAFPKKHGRDARATHALALVLALLPVAGSLWLIQRPLVLSNEETPALVFRMPPELADKHAWIWSDELSGSFWYYAHKPAHKVIFSDADTRALVYKFVNDRQEPQYIVDDGPDMTKMKEEIISLGARLESKGLVNGRSYFLVHWPAEGQVKP